METALTTAPPSAPAISPGHQQFVGVPLTEAARVLVLLLGWLACISGVFGNVLIIVTLLSQPALRSLHNLYIGNLALADLIVVGYCVPFWLLDLVLGYQPVLNQAHCKANYFLLFLCVNASIYTLVLISCNRYLNICHPAVYGKLFSRTKTFISCFLVWVISGLESILPLFHVGHSFAAYSVLVHMCTFSATSPVNLSSILSIVNLVVPTILVGFFSGSILCFWRQSRNRISHWTQAENQAASNPRPKLTSANLNLIRSLVLVSLLLVLLYLPLAVAVAMTSLIRIVPDVYGILVLFFFFNHSINWIVYGALNKNFKNGYKRLLIGRCANISNSTENGTGFTLATIH